MIPEFFQKNLKFLRAYLARPQNKDKLKFKEKA
jgi:hypothetical protein